MAKTKKEYHFNYDIFKKKNKDYTLADQAAGRCPVCRASADMDCDCEKKTIKVGSYEPTDWETYNPNTKKYDKSYFAWEVNLPDGGSFSCKKQIDAEILSRLVRIEETLRRLEKKKYGN